MGCDSSHCRHQCRDQFWRMKSADGTIVADASHANHRSRANGKPSAMLQRSGSVADSRVGPWVTALRAGAQCWTRPVLGTNLLDVSLVVAERPSTSVRVRSVGFAAAAYWRAERVRGHGGGTRSTSQTRSPKMELYHSRSASPAVCFDNGQRSTGRMGQGSSTAVGSCGRIKILKPTRACFRSPVEFCARCRRGDPPRDGSR